MSPKKVKCPVCKATFVGVDALRIHMIQEHSGH